MALHTLWEGAKALGSPAPTEGAVAGDAIQAVDPLPGAPAAATRCFGGILNAATGQKQTCLHVLAPELPSGVVKATLKINLVSKPLYIKERSGST